MIEALFEDWITIEEVTQKDHPEHHPEQQQ